MPIWTFRHSCVQSSPNLTIRSTSNKLVQKSRFSSPVSAVPVSAERQLKVWSHKVCSHIKQSSEAPSPAVREESFITRWGAGYIFMWLAQNRLYKEMQKTHTAN